MYPNPKRAKKLYSEVVPKTVDDYLSNIEKYSSQEIKDKIINPVWHVHNGKPPQEKIVMPFSMLLNLVGSSNADTKEVLWKFINRFHKEINPKDHKILNQLTEYAINYFKDKVEPNKKYKKPNSSEKKALENLVRKLKQLDQSLKPEEIQTQVYTVGKENGYEKNLREWFKLIYEVVFGEETKSLKTSIPFVKNNEFDYTTLVSWMGETGKKYAWIVFVLMVIFVVTAVSNGANMTDGLDGLATGTSAIIGATLGILAYVSGNVFFADYLNIMYLPNSGELVIYMAAFVGACVGFLWYNSYPAQVFMGDTGSLALGGIIAVFAIAIRKELLIPVLCGIFLVENLSVMLQVGYFKYTKKKFGEGRRIFKMAPLHHHFQKLGMHESKIVTRFWIAGVMLAILTIVTLKLR